MKIDLKEEIEISNNVQVVIEKGIVRVKGPKGEIDKKLLSPRIKISIKENKVLLESKKATKREKKLLGTFKAHIKSMIKGVVESYTYKLKICSSHFPMAVSVEDNQFIVKNFLGETIPRITSLKEGVTVKIEGDDIIVNSPNKELASQTAASIEQLCKISGRDKRIFQDGIWIVSKAGKEIK